MISQSNFSNLDPNFFVSIPYTVDTAGDIKAIVDWTFEDDTLWMYLAEGQCFREFASPSCPFTPDCPCDIKARSEAMMPKPRELRTSNQPPGRHSLVVWNRGPETESISWQVILTTLSSARVTGQYADSDEPVVMPIRKPSP